MSASLCPRFHKAIELIGGRWTGPVLQILLSGPARFAALRDAIPHISDRMLSERLHELEAEDIVARSVFPASPIRVEYALTQKGRELQASLEAIGKWAERWIVLPGPAGHTRVAQSSRATRPRVTGVKRDTPTRAAARS